MGISNDAVLIIQALLAIAAWLGKRMLERIEKNQCDILREVRITNGTVIKLEQAILDHDKLDETRFDSIEKRLDRQEDQ